MTKITYIIVAVAMGLTTTALAETTVLKVSKKSRAVYFKVSNNASIEPGDILINASSTKDQLCKLKVTKIKDSMGVGTSKNCKFKLSQMFIKGDALIKLASVSQALPVTAGSEPATFSQRLSRANVGSNTGSQISAEMYVNAPKAKNDRHYFGGQIFHSMADEIEAEGKMEGYDARQNDQTDTAFGVSAFYKYKSMTGLGGMAGLEYEFGRTLESYKVNAGGMEMSGDYSARDLNMLILANNLFYHFTDTIFVYSGLNYPLRIRVKGHSETKYKGDLGYQVGAGLELASNFFAALEFREINASGEIDAIEYEIKKMTMRGGLLRIGFQF